MNGGGNSNGRRSQSYNTIASKNNSSLTSQQLLGRGKSVSQHKKLQGLKINEEDLNVLQNCYQSREDSIFEMRISVMQMIENTYEKSIQEMQYHLRQSCAILLQQETERTLIENHILNKYNSNEMPQIPVDLNQNVKMMIFKMCSRLSKINNAYFQKVQFYFPRFADMIQQEQCQWNSSFKESLSELLSLSQSKKGTKSSNVFLTTILQFVSLRSRQRFFKEQQKFSCFPSSYFVLIDKAGVMAHQYDKNNKNEKFYTDKQVQIPHSFSYSKHLMLKYYLRFDKSYLSPSLILQVKSCYKNPYDILPLDESTAQVVAQSAQSTTTTSSFSSTTKSASSFHNAWEVIVTTYEKSLKEMLQANKQINHFLKNYKEKYTKWQLKKQQEGSLLSVQGQQRDSERVSQISQYEKEMDSSALEQISSQSNQKFTCVTEKNLTQQEIKSSNQQLYFTPSIKRFEHQYQYQSQQPKFDHEDENQSIIDCSYTNELSKNTHCIQNVFEEEQQSFCEKKECIPNFQIHKIKSSPKIQINSKEVEKDITISLESQSQQLEDNKKQFLNTSHFKRRQSESSHNLNNNNLIPQNIENIEQHLKGSSHSSHRHLHKFVANQFQNSSINKNSAIFSIKGEGFQPNFQMATFHPNASFAKEKIEKSNNQFKMDLPQIMQPGGLKTEAKQQAIPLISFNHFSVKSPSSFSQSSLSSNILPIQPADQYHQIIEKNIFSKNQSEASDQTEISMKQDSLRLPGQLLLDAQKNALFHPLQGNTDPRLYNGTFQYGKICAGGVVQQSKNKVQCVQLSKVPLSEKLTTKKQFMAKISNPHIRIPELIFQSQYPQKLLSNSHQNGEHALSQQLKQPSDSIEAKVQDIKKKNQELLKSLQLDEQIKQQQFNRKAEINQRIYINQGEIDTFRSQSINIQDKQEFIQPLFRGSERIASGNIEENNFKGRLSERLFMPDENKQDNFDQSSFSKTNTFHISQRQDFLKRKSLLDQNIARETRKNLLASQMSQRNLILNAIKESQQGDHSIPIKKLELYSSVNSSQLGCESSQVNERYLLIQKSNRLSSQL